MEQYFAEANSNTISALYGMLKETVICQFCYSQSLLHFLFLEGIGLLYNHLIGNFITPLDYTVGIN